MGIENALTDTGGNRLVRSGEEWDDWVSATKTRNFILRDPILDWLELYGREHGFLPDTESDEYDPRTDFREFIFEKGRAFEDAATRYLAGRCQVEVVARTPSAIRQLESVEKTFQLMCEGTEIIAQGVLWNARTRTFGAPDLLVRSDVLHRLWPDALTEEESHVPATDLGGGPWHYRVVDIKFTTLRFLSSGALGNTGSTPGYKVQVWLYNEALFLLQGYAPPCGYVLGRAWEEGFGDKRRGDRADERLGVVQAAEKLNGRLVSEWAMGAVDWIRRLRREGRAWKATPEPTVQELRPNMGNTSDGPWHAAKAQIAEEQEELTLLWQVGVDKRDAAIAAGVTSWRSPECAPEAVGVRGAKQAPILQALLDVNRDTGGPAVRPAKVHASEDQWRIPEPVEFYVDFETVTDLDDDFTAFPQRGRTPLITMIGCGHLEGGNWSFECFSVDALTEQREAAIIDAWHDHMDTVASRLAPTTASRRVFHWSPAEVSFLESAYNAAVRRHPDRNWPAVEWVDLLKLVIKAEPVVVRGALGFGLKAVAKAMYREGLIDTSWDDGPVDGLGAMVGTWWCAHEAERRGVSMNDLDLMQEIRRYNEVDCRVMMEILRYLRSN